MNNLINVIDDILTKEEMKELRELYSRHIWKKGHTGAYDNHYHFSAMGIDEEDIVQKIKIKIDKLMKEYYPDIFDGISLERVYGSLQAPGQTSGIHFDRPEENKPHSALLFVHAEWDPQWGGATTIYDENYEIIDSVLPYPNRLLLFPSHFKHNGSGVDSSALIDRMILIYQYNNIK